MRSRHDPRWRENRGRDPNEMLRETIAKLPKDQQERIAASARRQERFAAASERMREDPAGERRKVAEYMAAEDPQTLGFMKDLAGVFGRLEFVGTEVGEYTHKGETIVHRGRVALDG